MEDRATEPSKTAAVAAAEQGIVVLEGPNGLAAAMTAEAADETADRLHAAAQEARRQRGSP